MQIIVARSANDEAWQRRGQPRPITKRVSPSDRAEVERLLAQKARITTTIRDAFLAALDRIGDKLEVDRIVALLRAGRIDEAIAAVQPNMVLTEFEPLGQVITSGTIAAGQSEAAQAANLTGMTIGLSVTDPQFVNAIRVAELTAVRETSASVLTGIRSIIEGGVRAGINPVDIARDIRGMLGLTARQTRAVMNYRRALEEGSRAALDRALRDKRHDPTVERSISQGVALKPEQIDKMVSRYADRYLKYRAETIARTEAIRALSIGTRLLWQQAVAGGKISARDIRRKWVYTHDDRVRPAHVAIPGLNPSGIGMNEPFATPLGPLMYPGDPAGTPDNVCNCRCVVVTRFQPGG